MSNPRCLYCGNDMCECGSKGVYSYHCAVCGATSPISTISFEAANKETYRRPFQRPMTFDECMVYGDTEQQTDMIPDPVWLEYRDPDGWTGWVCLEDHVYHPPEDSRGRGLYIMHPGCDVEGKSEYEADYGKTWRCWSRRPTDQEKAEAEWNG